MRTAITWTPLLRGDGTTGTAAGAAGPDAANSYPLPREKDVADAHPLAPPRVKQRPRRATSAMATTAAKSAATAASARRRASTPATRGSSAPLTSGGVDVSDYDPLVAAFGGVSAHPADRSAESGAAAADPLSELWMPPPPPSTAAALLGGEGDVGVVDSAAAAPAPAVRQALFDSEERDVKVAAAGLSDDPLSMMMQERAVASNMSRHGGVLMDGGLLGDATTSASAASIAAAEGLLAESEAGGAAATATGGKGERGMSDGSGPEGGAGWGRQWEAHRLGILREFGGGGADIHSGADKAAGPTPRSTAPLTSHAARLQELQGPAKGGGGESGAVGGSGGGGGSGGKKAKSVSGRGMAGGLLLTAEEYRAHVAGLKEELETAWAREEKVAALKVTVQAAKLLGDVSVPSSYPALFASVADLLEAFGVMVFERIRSRAGDSGEEAARPSQGESSIGEAPSIVLPGAEERHTLPKGWTCDDVGPEARETCRNWFYKTACIRELLPRVLVEAALLPCYRFLANEDEFGQILGRLSTLVRGVGDPMVAVYCSCFISAAGAKIAPRESAHAVASVQDYLFSLQEVQQGKLDGFLRANRLGLPEYLHLHTPAVDWLLGIVGPGAPRAVFTSILTHYRNHCGSLEVLRLILTHFSSEHYAPFALDMALLIKQGKGFSTRCTTAEVMGLLGRKLGGAKGTKIPGPDAVPLLNEAWQEISPAPLEVYMEGATAWLGVLLRSRAYGPDEVAILVENVACRIEEESPSGRAVVQGRLADGVVSALACAEDPSALQAAGEHVVKILAALDKNRRAQACLDLLTAFLAALPEPAPTRRTGARSSSLPLPSPSPLTPAAALGSPPPPEGNTVSKSESGGGGRAGKGADTSEAVLARALVGVAKLLHDSLDLLSSGERQRQSAVSLTCDMVDRVGRGWERPPEPTTVAQAGKGTAESGGGGGGAADDGGGTGEGSRLAVLADCRQAFWGMDEVTDRLVLAAVGLSVRAWRAGSDATARAALCFCSLTVPSVPSALRRLALLQLCANTALQVGKPALADALFRSAICVVPDCSPLVVSGGDSGGSSRGSGGLYSSPTASDTGRKSYGGGGGGGAVAGMIGGGGGGWGLSPLGPGGVFGTGVRREHAGAWLLCDAVKSLLGALVAVPGHPDLGPFYLLRGLLKAVRRLPWPAGSGLLASIYITAVGMLCAMWQERLPYSVGAAATAALGDSRGENAPDKDGDSSISSSSSSSGETATDTVATATADGTGGGGGDGSSIPAGVALALSGGGGGGGGESVGKVGAGHETAVAGVGPASRQPSLESGTAVPDDKAAVDGGEESSGGDSSSPTAEGGEGGEHGSTVAEASAVSGHRAEDGAGPERKKSWLQVGGVLGTDELYLRNSTFLEEVRGLLGDVVMATLRELEELWEQGEAEMASMIGDDHARSARLRYGRLTLDLANQLVSDVEMEGGAASVVTFLIEAAARAGARQTGGGSSSSGGGRRRGSGTVGGGEAAGYFEHTVAFVSGVAESRLARLAERRSDSVKAEQQEEACLSLSQGLSGFCAPSSR